MKYCSLFEELFTKLLVHFQSTVSCKCRIIMQPSWSLVRKIKLAQIDCELYYNSCQSSEQGTPIIGPRPPLLQCGEFENILCYKIIAAMTRVLFFPDQDEQYSACQKFKDMSTSSFYKLLSDGLVWSFGSRKFH